MKVARFVLKIVSFSLFLAALVCAIIAYWDRLTDLVTAAKDTMPLSPSQKAEYADYEE